MTQRSAVSKFLLDLGRHHPKSMFSTSWRLLHADSKRVLLEGGWLAVSRQGGKKASPFYYLLVPDKGRDGLWVARIGGSVPRCRKDALLFGNLILVMKRPQDVQARDKLVECVRSIQFTDGESVDATLPHQTVKDAVRIRPLAELPSPGPRARAQAPHTSTSPAKSRRARLHQAQAAATTPRPAAAPAPPRSKLAQLGAGGTSSFLDVIRRRYGDPVPHSKLGSLTTGSPVSTARSTLAGAPREGGSPLWQALRTHNGPLPSKSTPFSRGVRGLGLRNLGNTCYMNAVLQALAACTSFRRDLFSSVWREVFREEAAVTSGDASGSPLRYRVPQERAHAHEALIQVFRQLMRRGRPGDGVGPGPGRVAADPGALRQAIAHKRDAFSSFMQQDAHEFLIELLDVLSEEDLPRSRRACAVLLRHTQRTQAALTPAAEACMAASDWVMDEDADVFPSPDHVAMVAAGMPAEDVARAVRVSPARATRGSGTARSPVAAPSATAEAGSACAGDVVDLVTPRLRGRKRPRGGSAEHDTSPVAAAGDVPAPQSPDEASGSGGSGGDAGEAPESVRTPQRASPSEGAEEGYMAVNEDAPVVASKVARLRRACDAAIAVMPASRSFRGVVQTQVQCAGCGHKRSSATAYHVLSLHRPASYLGTGGADTHVGVKALCDSFFSGGEMEARCPSCGHEAATHRLRLECLPRVLVLHVKRFNVDVGADGAPRLSKDCTEVEAPPELDVAPWCAEECWLGPSGPLRADAQEDAPGRPEAAGKAGTQNGARGLRQWRTGEPAPGGRGARYRLKSIVHHHGSEAYFGHYTASVLQSAPQGEGKGRMQWVEFNDSSSRVAAGGEFEWMTYAERPEVRRSSYLYFYERAEQ